MPLSSSLTFAVRVAVLPLKLEPPPLAVWVMVTASSAPSASLTGERVTVWLVFQLEVVKLREAGLTVTAAVSPLLTLTVTPEGG